MYTAQLIIIKNLSRNMYKMPSPLFIVLTHRQFIRIIRI